MFTLLTQLIKSELGAVARALIRRNIPQTIVKVKRLIKYCEAYSQTRKERKMSCLTQPSGAGWRRLSLFVLLAGSTLATSAFAVPGNYQIQQTGTDTQSYSGFDSGANSTGNWAWVAPSPVSINPFSSYNTGSGSLLSVTVEWTHLLSFSGTTGTGGGNIGGGGGTSAYINAISYNGSGSSAGDSNGPSAPVSFSQSYCASTPCISTFTAANAGVTFDPNIWTILSGSSVFTVKSDNTGSVSWSGVVSGLVSMSSTVTVTYNYFGEPVPSNAPIAPAASLLGLGLAVIGLSNAARRRGSRRQVPELS